MQNENTEIDIGLDSKYHKKGDITEHHIDVQAM